MVKKISDVLGVSEDIFNQTGAFNIVVGLDSLFHIDPYLLKSSKIPEFKSAYKKFHNYFRDIIKLLDETSNNKSRLWREAVKRLTFKEVSYINLGYSKKSNRGNAIGPELAEVLCYSASEIIKSGIKDPVVFELVGLFEEKIGPDRVSDMTGRIILENLFEYTQRILTELKINKTRKIKFNSKEFVLPLHKEPIVLLPMEILSPLPVAYSWDDIDRVCAYNEALRNRVNQIIGNTWKDATNRKKVSKRTLKQILTSEPEVLKDLISLYKEKPAKGYDFVRDPLGETKWLDLSKEFTNKYYYSLDAFKPLSHKNITDVIIAICNKYSDLIENNGLFKFFYNDGFDLRHERFPQLLFFGIADSYCAANNLDINREPNAGRGSVDFKFSFGYESRVNVEVKYSTNKRLLSGYTTQLKTYDKAEKTFYSIYLVLQVANNERTIKKLLKLKNDVTNKGERTPEVIIIDARYKKTASKVE